MDDEQGSDDLSWPNNAEAEALLGKLLGEKFTQTALRSISEDVGIDTPGAILRSTDLVYSILNNSGQHQKIQLLKHLLGEIPGGPQPKRAPHLNSALARLKILCTVSSKIKNPEGEPQGIYDASLATDTQATPTQAPPLPLQQAAPETQPSMNAEQHAPIAASPEVLLRMIQTFHPIVWVGAGASQAAGYPGTKALLAALQDAADDPLPLDKDFTEVVDAFVRSMGRSALERVLEQRLAPPRTPTPFHRSLARLVKAGSIRTIITTNYDDLLERAFADANVHVTEQQLDRNFRVVATPDTPRLLKIHGDRADWQSAILSGQSYSEFNTRYSRLEAQLNLMRTQNAFVFFGCSMMDPRILTWLDQLGQSERERLQPWRAIMLEAGWNDFLRFQLNGRPSTELISGTPLRPIIVPSHDAAIRLWTEVADKLAPPVSANSTVVPPVPSIATLTPSVAPNNETGLSAPSHATSKRRPHGTNRGVWFGSDRRVWNRNSLSNTNETAQLASSSGAYLRVIPGGWNGTMPGAAAMLGRPNDLGFTPLGRWNNGTFGVNADGALFRTVGSKLDDVWHASTATQWFDDTGEIWGFDADALTQTPEGIFLSYEYLLKQWRTFLNKSLSTLQHFGATGPFTIEAGVVGLQGVRWAARFQRDQVLALKDAAFFEDRREDWSAESQLLFLERAFNHVRKAFGLQNMSAAEFQRLLSSSNSA
ncbi:SIR2 family protein [Corallococcus sp. AB049A]|uniref:SIR2 family protein n=1 Tax=Corallococcus sp. AB049A TaxID=2316721 RepID=UPI0013159218|nr:SIR2 family protein [Corallococcus sp. AB049A]